MSSPKICFVLGTRPEIIKLYSSIKFCVQNSVDYFVVHTNQHYNPNMDTVFFEELKLDLPKYNLNVGSGSHASMTAKMLIGIEEALLVEKPTVVVVQGDTNSTMAGALVAAKMDIKVAHIEAGLRSYDRTMPEETNRIMVDHISDFLFSPTQKQFEIILGEGIDKNKIHMVGNTVVDAVLECKKLIKSKAEILKSLGVSIASEDVNLNPKTQNLDSKIQKENSFKFDITDDLFATSESLNHNIESETAEIKPKKVEAEDIFADVSSIEIKVETNPKVIIQETNFKYFLLTCHRPSNTEIPQNFEAILTAIQELCLKYKAKCIFPIHPRLKAKKALLETFSEILIVEPVGFLDSIALQVYSDMIFTDSGGIQEESCILECKAVILRTNTERPESVEVGGAILLGTLEKQDIVDKFEALKERKVEWSNPFGDGKSGQKIVEIIAG